MDKNTLLGLLLMAACLFGFMYINKPSEEELAQRRAQQEQTLSQKQAAQQTAGATAAEQALSQADIANLAAALRITGTDNGNGSFSLNNESVQLTADSTGVSGSVTVGATQVPLSHITAGGSSPLSPEQNASAVAALHDIINKSLKYKSFARHLGGTNDSITIETPLMKVTFATRGGMVSQVELKKYNTELGTEPAPIRLFQDHTDGYSFTLITADQRLDTREFNFQPTMVNDSTVEMTLPLGNDIKWGFRYTVHPATYLVRMEIIQQGMEAILPASTAAIDLNWHQKMTRNEMGRTFEERNSAILYKYVNESVDELSANGNDDAQLTGRIKWVAFKNQFFSSVLIADDYMSSADLNSVEIKNDRFLKDMTLHATVPYTTTTPSVGFNFYFGPNNYPLLADIDDEISPDQDLSLTRLVPLGWGLFRWINQLLVIPVFTFLGKYIANYGIIILLLTIFIKIIIFPFTFKSFKSQARMRVLAPEIKEINDKYPGQENAMKRQQETMSLYSRAGASPFSGCLPMLLQMPVLIAMFSFFPSAIELRGQSFLWVHDLSAPDYICTLPFSIPFYGNHVSLFCLLMTVVNIVYTKINMQNQPGGSSMPGMKWMMYLMPLMFLFFFNDYAAGLSYYYFLSLLITIVQTWIFRHVIDEKKVRAELLANAKKPRKKSGFMARLEEAQRQQQAALRQQQKGGRR